MDMLRTILVRQIAGRNCQIGGVSPAAHRLRRNSIKPSSSRQLGHAPCRRGYENSHSPDDQSMMAPGACDSRLHDSSEEGDFFWASVQRPISTQRGVLGNWNVSQLEGKAEPTCQP
jgi:hypothetical protein